jgi:ribulose 1,5-bisphosphate synthetase/thiazole synthase
VSSIAYERSQSLNLARISSALVMANELFDAIVVGGGPAGSTAATLLAKDGRKVLVLEREYFPRYHIASWG